MTIQMRTPPLAEEHAHERAVLANLRTRLETELERMIELLDQLDGDPDLEPDTDAEPDEDGEPTLGWQNTPSQVRLRVPYEDGELEDKGTTEPSLGSIERWGEANQ